MDIGNGGRWQVIGDDLAGEAAAGTRTGGRASEWAGGRGEKHASGPASFHVSLQAGPVS